MNRKITRSMLMLSAASFLLAPAAMAQGVEEIVVTAQKREQSLQDVPIAVTAFTGEELRQRSARAVADALDSAPNVSFTSGASGGDDAQFFIRGIGQVDNSLTVDPGVGVYIDEVYLGRQQGASFDLLDIERIEVLRGPQGTLFGRNTIGGAINVVTSDPSLDGFEGDVTFIGGSWSRFEGRARLNMPVADRVAVKVSALARSQEGFAENVFTSETFGDSESYAGRIDALFEANDSLTFEASVDLAARRNSPQHTITRDVAGGPAFCRFLPPPGGAPGGPGGPPGGPGGPPPGGPPPGGAPGGPPPGGAPGGAPPPAAFSPLCIPFPADLTNNGDAGQTEDNFASVPNQDDTDSWGASLVINWDAGPVQIKSITAYRELEEFGFSDFDGSQYAFYDFTNEVDQSQFSQEVQVAGELLEGRSRFLLGGYYFDETVDNTATLCVGTTADPLVRVCPSISTPIDLEITTWALFGNLEFDITDRFSIFGGLRFSHEEKSQETASIFDNTSGMIPAALGIPQGVVSLLGGTISDEQEFDSWTPKIGGSFDLNDTTLIYASYAEGFKSGGARLAVDTIQSYDPEEVSTYEIGVKSDLLDNRLRLNVAAFYSDYTDIQLLVSNELGQVSTANVGDAEIWGAEVEAFASPIRGLNLTAAIGWTDAEYTTINGTFPGLSIDDDLPLTPEWNFSASAAYTFFLANDDELTVRADWNWRSEFTYQLENDPLELSDSYGLLNLRGTWALIDPDIEFSAFVLNVLDEEYFRNMVDNRGQQGIATGSPGRPLEFGVEARFRF